MTVCFCTLAIHTPYRQRAKLLCASAPSVPWLVLTDEPDDFIDLPVRAIHHTPTGPMAIDYLSYLSPTGENNGAAAYHDKRFVIQRALQNFDTAIYMDADSRIVDLPQVGGFPPGLAVIPLVQRSIAEHLSGTGTWRKPIFVEMASQLTGNDTILESARWCHETPIAISKDGAESRFFEAWSFCTEFLQAREVYSGEGGVIGLAAAYAGWNVDYDSLGNIAASISHEGSGPKKL